MPSLYAKNLARVSLEGRDTKVALKAPSSIKAHVKPSLRLLLLSTRVAATLDATLTQILPGVVSLCLIVLVSASLCLKRLLLHHLRFHAGGKGGEQASRSL